ncbi:N-acetyl-gamma-glutamyl-phosphate reductase [Marinospirillum insulare]|uniref:N-acetyl-gamma-glutamyl-phosphate reductase n=1 Tax=Marinospirillum insulare TaxID=217169 RepID=A0ABQ6A0H9_9GAMM|nr:N-acetyl-gamma-glutamyl-phosphate reductase [Marinospirillum insulare]GLR64072.1 N-acetyl-gamma-glutamyl-phosphate reductase [Marinospirillum insulare]
MIKIGIVGGTGYTGVELLRLLASHPNAQVEVITSRSEAGVGVAEMYPNLRGHYSNLFFTEPDVALLAACDVVFFATPHGVAHALAGELLDAGTRVIDLSADFRLNNAEEWAEWYGQPHGAPELLKESVYGLPEIAREEIKTARLIAVPGCYPTAVELGLLPLFEKGLVETQGVIADCKTGVSGAGRGAKVPSLFCEAAESIKAYAVGNHRHHPEITQELTKAAGQPVGLTFVPHLLPMIRGIHATLYVRLNTANQGLTDAELQELFEMRYKNEPSVDIMPWNSCPETRSVRGANVCRIGLHRPQGSDLVIVLAVIDNLVKGASGQAIQNMNIMFGQDELAGLTYAGLMP